MRSVFFFGTPNLWVDTPQEDTQPASLAPCRLSPAPRLFPVGSVPPPHCTVRLDESPVQFMDRMKCVEDFMNSPNFAKAGGGRGLAGLARELRGRCEEVIARKGERIPK